MNKKVVYFTENEVIKRHQKSLKTTTCVAFFIKIQSAYFYT